MRRSFNKALLPKDIPQLGTWEGKNIGSKFNQWFRAILTEHNLKMKDFCQISKSNYRTAMGWRYKNEPRIHGKIEIARGLSIVGAGSYSGLLKEIKALCKY
jgi:hypothetical protein